MSRYDRAITVFSPDGRLFQVEYALEAVRKGTTAVAVRGDDMLVLGVEKKSTAKLQDDRTVRKIVSVDKHIALTFAGLTADARVLVDRARVEAQSHRLTVEDAPTVEYITKYIAGVQQRYTQSGGRRPFGISTLIIGFDVDGTPRLFCTDPAGTFTEWKANATGQGAKTVREYLQDKYDDGKGDPLRLAVESLLEVVEAKSNSIEVAVMERGKPLRLLDDDEVAELVDSIEAQR
eukprot:CAMPEP_0198339720 /NCGR_PEP_ID=MMETSP1450-20131203/41463_1 /TAXON_ID=753684 ORGANISM="Madagascaria erythrocladiodes, Strain CCMP3234" /NCGR_SAMPLE_ID=MMETSP1450 /ASSEMBLY_ACC=CAM_ASM_001115 /LENGTH=233 /DNA_ID=CAMNT_0044044665 /DNA_START=91 /DNA_END=789 /DNA_ORIENTATION=-